jgi:hypothetical protein
MFEFYIVYNRDMNNDNGVAQGLEEYYDFKSIKSNVEGLTINGKIVGQDPSNFERSELYKKNFEKMGNSKENIKIIENFISDAECDVLVTLTKRIKPKEFPVQWDHNFKPVVIRKTYVDLPVRIYVPIVQEALEGTYEFPVINRSVSIARWDAGDKLDLHVDDLGTTNYNHMATLIYLNDDYEGGEIVFPTHDFSYRPKMGDLIMFPGNMHYAHEVRTITSGSRYSMPMWFEFA